MIIITIIFFSAQHQQPYDLNSNDMHAPVEQLSQQVQRIPNPPSQVNVISQHHLQSSQQQSQHHGGNL